MTGEEVDYLTGGNRIKIITGHYGSGKTEIALNLARALRQAGFSNVALADMDIINPYFRSAEQWEWLKAHGIELIASEFALSSVELPTLPAELLSIFAREDLRAVLDVGGDDAGAIALGQYSSRLEASGYDLLYVINVFRPRSETPDEIIDMMERVAASARLAPTGIINNSNMGGLTTPEDIRRGADILAEVSARSGLPIVATCGRPEVLGRMDIQDKFLIERLMKPEWMES